MSVAAKICGLNQMQTLAAALDGGAAFVGFVFYPPSPRALTPAAAGPLVRRVPGTVTRVGLFVDASDEEIAAVLAEAELDLLQLHGAETPARVVAVKARFGLPVMKAVKVAARTDVAGAEVYEAVADILLFDAKPPLDMSDALPGGNGLVFDWNLLRRRVAGRPWMLSGGLDQSNVAAAVRISGATMVDVSSGVEAAPGRKDPARIKAFLDAVRAL